ncbi:hypothetical protein B566_EDAN015824 [Ephemera danica]|nr:hypothetical protein B566_EDAN015824 [Ephemera danica]
MVRNWTAATEGTIERIVTVFANTSSWFLCNLLALLIYHADIIRDVYNPWSYVYLLFANVCMTFSYVFYSCAVLFHSVFNYPMIAIALWVHLIIAIERMVIDLAKDRYLKYRRVLNNTTVLLGMNVLYASCVYVHRIQQAEVLLMTDILPMTLLLCVSFYNYKDVIKVYTIKISPRDRMLYVLAFLHIAICIVVIQYLCTIVSTALIYVAIHVM